MKRSNMHNQEHVDCKSYVDLIYFFMCYISLNKTRHDDVNLKIRNTNKS